MQEFIPLHAHSDYSLLDGLSKTTKIAERCAKLNYTACALTDHGSISGCISFIKALKDCCKCGHQKGIHDRGKRCRHKSCSCAEFTKCGIKPILGSEFYLCPKDPTVKEKDNRKLSHLVVLAKNLQGWRNLIQATSEANKPEHVWYKKPRLNLEKLADFANGQFIAFSGHLGSDLANICFADIGLAYKATTYEQAKTLVRPDWKEATLELAGKYVELFDKENFYIEIQLIDAVNIPAAQIVAKILRWVAQKLDLRCVATPDAHYPTKQDAGDQRILLCSQFKTTLRAIERKQDLGEDVTLGGFFRSNNYHIPCLEEIVGLHTEDELKATVEIAEKCEVYNVLGQPILPNFECPDNLSNYEYLRKLSLDGWQKKIVPHIPADNRQIYADRVKHEMEVIKKAGLAGYFLVVQDFVNFARKQGSLIGPGRGSGAGCLVSDLVGITSVDPIEYGLIFERFYNEGRNTADHIEFPDIDCDFPKAFRPKVFQYVRDKYGHDKVAQMITFDRIQGRSAIKVVMSAWEACSFAEMNKICKEIPDEAKISDKLQDMRERDGEASIIRWALENNREGLKQWCYLNDNGELEGEFAQKFAQAIRLEGTKKNQGKHASGVVMAPIPLAEICPMVYDKNENSVVAGFEMGDLQAIGLIKFDILGVSVLDKVMGVQELLANGQFVLP